MKKIFFTLFILTLVGCSATKMPPEVQLVEDQERGLWSAEAPLYTPHEFAGYRASVQDGRNRVAKEKEKFRWFRDFTEIAAEYRNILKQGEELAKKVQTEKDVKADAVANQTSIYQNRIDSLREVSGKINEGKLARKDLVKAELVLEEAAFLHREKKYIDAEKRLEKAMVFIRHAEDSILPIFHRYSDRRQIKTWQKWVAETLAASRKNGIMAIIVDKSERSLTLYRGGVPVKKYAVGLGRNGSVDKRHAGDNATPEGKYRIIRKVPNSRYHKALLINYPNDEDRRQFHHARTRGLIPEKTGIGGLIEIHGGGKDSMTYGCVALENRHIDELYQLVGTGTLVTIVGAVDLNNKISTAVQGL